MIDALIFASFWLAYALAFQLKGWGHGLQIVSRKPMLVDWSRSDFRIVRLVKGNKLGYWAIRSMYGFPVIVAMTCWYGEPWILAIGLLPQTIGLFGYLVGRLTQSKNAWRLVECWMGVVMGCMMILMAMEVKG